MSDAAALIARSGACVRIGASITEGLRLTRQSRLLAGEAACTPQITAALQRAERNLTDALQDIETLRKRLLRKADRKEQANG